MGKRFVSFFTAFVILSAFAFYPLHVLAAEPDDFAAEILQNYKSLGMDSDGNVILSSSDYELYINDVLAAIEKDTNSKSESETIVQAQKRALTKSSSSSDLILDEVKEKSRFLDLPIFNNFVVDAIKWMVTECLSNPIYAGEELPEESETESETETETEPTPPTTSTETVSGIAGLASNLQKYTINGNDLYERIDIAFSSKLATTKEDSDVKATVTRSGLGATASYELTYDASKQSRNINITWGSSSYTRETFGFPTGTMYAGYTLDIYRLEYTNDSNVASFSGFSPRVYNFSVNQLPVISRSGSTTVTLPSILTGSNAVFAENSFYSNNPTYISNHTINASTNNYWNSYNVSVNNTNSYITTGTTINTTNYNDYSQYGYYVNDSGGLSIDEVTLQNYIQNTLLAGILAGYVDFYTRFPEVGVNVTDTDITYVDPFDTGEEPTQSESSGGTGNITIDADGNVYIDGTIADLQIIASAGAGIYIEGANITINQSGDNITNNYYYYTDPVEPSATTTTTTIILPPDTSSEAATYPPIIPDAEPKYTLDMSAVYSDMSYIKQQSNQISVTRSLWVVSLLDKILQDTQLLPLFLFLFLMSVLGVLLWK